MQTEELILLAAEFVAKGLALPQYILEGLDAHTLKDIEDMRKGEVYGSKTSIIGKSSVSR